MARLWSLVANGLNSKPTPLSGARAYMTWWCYLGVLRDLLVAKDTPLGIDFSGS